MGKAKMKMLILIAFLSLGLMGCSESLTSNIGTGLTNPGTPIDPGVGIPRGEVPTTDISSGFPTGATATLVPVSHARMEQYTMRTLNNPTNIKLNVSLDNFGGGAIGGFVKIAYDDLGQRVEGKFNAGDHSHDAQYNRWFTHQGKEVFHGFFEDSYGAVVLVVDDVLNLGDGGSQDTVSGSVWFLNHRITAQTGPNPSNSCLPGFGCPNTRCWFLEIGPFSCQAFVRNGAIDTTSGLYPDNGYTKLGDFTGLSRSIGFAGN